MNAHDLLARILLALTPIAPKKGFEMSTMLRDVRDPLHQPVRLPTGGRFFD